MNCTQLQDPEPSPDHPPRWRWLCLLILMISWSLSFDLGQILVCQPTDPATHRPTDLPTNHPTNWTGSNRGRHTISNISGTITTALGSYLLPHNAQPLLLVGCSFTQREGRAPQSVSNHTVSSSPLLEECRPRLCTLWMVRFSLVIASIGWGEFDPVSNLLACARVMMFECSIFARTFIYWPKVTIFPSPRTHRRRAFDESGLRGDWEHAFLHILDKDMGRFGCWDTRLLEQVCW